ncbi:MAG TPA: PilZ domain-containing protein [Candidatus Competibacter sp.]|nr:PilZ domain-containing protein [Candidatus Competibacter sp.]
MLIKDDNTAIERRKFKRYPLIYYLDSIDLETKQCIGQLIDISLEGAMLISKIPVPSGIKVKLSIVLPTGFSDENYLVVEAESVRNCRDINSDYYDTGLHFINVDPLTKKAIIGLIDTYGF